MLNMFKSIFKFPYISFIVLIFINLVQIFVGKETINLVDCKYCVFTKFHIYLFLFKLKDVTHKNSIFVFMES